ncbi:MAG: sigma-54-dependent Fis family transcriptional regulator [Deltaproteobacteria bacterium]|nr:sigma-54-dependent Fis family transcriptional regulator [Deltaproteobacteria bacterium]
MNGTTEQLLKWKNIGFIRFNAHFDIIEIDNVAKTMLKSVADQFSGGNLLELFPEFLGNEEEIHNLLKKKSVDFRLDYLNKIDRMNKLRFFNLLVLAENESDIGVVIIEDVTNQGRMAQEINQQKYELLLYKSNSEFRRLFLSKSLLEQSKAVQHIRNMIDKISKVPNSTVLLLGESGTGKSLTARIIHYSSMPVDAPFVDINCAAIPENLIEAELFGYEKGAFTNATATRQGLLEEAEGGTIFLDEIGELPFNLQAKLLSIIEIKKFRRLGSNKSIVFKARIITATNRNLQKEVVKKNFREDLYYRLDVVSIRLPPLRELGKDILIIADHLLTIFNIEFKKKIKGFTQSAKEALLAHTWPGNVRELSNCLERAMIFSENEQIDNPDLILSHPVHIKNGKEWEVPSTGILLEEIERELIISALKQAGNNKSKAARLLGLTRDTLRYRLEKYNIS